MTKFIISRFALLDREFSNFRKPAVVEFSLIFHLFNFAGKNKNCYAYNNVFSINVSHHVKKIIYLSDPTCLHSGRVE